MAGSRSSGSRFSAPIGPLAPFLALIEADLAARPEAVRPITAEQIARIDSLLGNCDIDLDAAFVPDGD